MNTDLPQQLGCHVNNWSMKVIQSLSEEGLIPKSVLLLLQQSNFCVYTVLCNTCVKFHPFVMQCTVSQHSTHPSKGPSIPFNNYFIEADFYYNMLGFIENFRVSLYNKYYQNQFIVHLQNATAIEDQVCRERVIPDPQDCHKCSNQMFIQHISGIAHSLQQISSKILNSIVTNKLHLMESKLHVLDGQELYDCCVCGIDIDNCEPSKCQNFEQTIHAVSSDFIKFDITKPCTLCGAPGQTFNNYPICARLAYNCFKKSIGDLGIKDLYSI